MSNDDLKAQIVLVKAQRKAVERTIDYLWDSIKVGLEGDRRWEGSDILAACLYPMPTIERFDIEAYIRALPWSGKETDDERTLVAGNLRELWASRVGDHARVLADDPEMDATDLAHPAWWRGNDAGVAAVVRIVNGLLDGKPHVGTYGSAELEALAQRIASALDSARHPGGRA